MNTSSSIPAPAAVARHLRPALGGDTQRCLPTDWRLMACVQATGREYLSDWGPEEVMRQAMQRAYDSNQDVWLIGPDGAKHLPDNHPASSSQQQARAERSESSEALRSPQGEERAKDGPDPRQLILAALRSEKPAHSPSLTALENERVAMIYRRAVLAVCRAMEEAAAHSELGSTGVPLEDLTPRHTIGEHLAATRRYFDLIP